MSTRRFLESISAEVWKCTAADENPIQFNIPHRLPLEITSSRMLNNCGKAH